MDEVDKSGGWGWGGGEGSGGGGSEIRKVEEVGVEEGGVEE